MSTTLDDLLKSKGPPTLSKDGTLSLEAKSFENKDPNANQRRYQARVRASTNEIGTLPPPEDEDLKEACSHDFKLFCEEYFPEVFNLAWSPDHLKVIKKIENAILYGGLFSMAMPRGSGKTSLCEVACIWALFYGHRRFICYIGPDSSLAHQALDSIKSDIETNEALEADFPEIVIPIQRLERITTRARGQTHDGVFTRAAWQAEQVVMPSIKGSRASGAMIKIAGLTGQIRGMKHKTAAGDAIRPDFIIADDPQTDQSARSPSQCVTRESILAGAILNLAGPGQKISGIMPCTVIQENDLADRMLNRKLHPEWQGERTKLVYRWPKNTDLWDEYTDRRRAELAGDGDGSQATEFYKENQAEMDEGAVCAWAERFNSDELSPLQHAYNLRMRDEVAFFSEYQNEPLNMDDLDGDSSFSADDVTSKMNGFSKMIVPSDVDKLVAYIDVHKSLLYYSVVGFSQDFTGFVIDYGTFPKQSTDYFNAHTTQETMMAEFRGAGFEGALWQGLEELTKNLFEKPWGDKKLDICLMDANWGETTDKVYSFCEQCSYPLHPAHGKYIGATSKPMQEYSGQATKGLNWRVPKVTKRQVRHVLYDTNFWKTFLFERVRSARGDAGSMSFFKGVDHRLLTDHLMAEYRVKVEAKNRIVHEWQVRPSRDDNHWLDCLTGCCVGASMLGVKLLPKKILTKTSAPPRVSQTRVTYL